MTDDAAVGRDPITYFSVEWDQGLGPNTPANWVTLNSGNSTRILSYTHTLTTNFPPNQYVYYRVRGKNGVGWGPYSTNL